MLLVAAVAALAADAARFEVASIRPADPQIRPGRLGSQIQTSPSLLAARASTLKELIAAAYAVEIYQVAGGPAWADAARFAVDAKPASPARREQLLLMLRPLLAERFQLAFHRETRELSVYALTVARNGPKFHRMAPGHEAEPGKLNHLGRNVDLAWFARYLTHFGADRPVIDRTGLTGNFDLDLDMEKIFAGAGESPEIGRVFEATADALEDQLGLRLVPTKAAVELLAIDHAARPSAN